MKKEELCEKCVILHTLLVKDVDILMLKCSDTVETYNMNYITTKNQAMDPETFKLLKGYITDHGY